jgi:RNA polymerase sigma-70 factor (ECF subfamily)
MANEPLDPDPREVREAEIRAAWAAEDHDGAVTLLLQIYGDELLSFMIARLRDRCAADEAFALLAEDLWRSLPRFEFRSSVRTWAYTVARHAAARYARAPQRRRDRQLTLSKHGQLSRLVEQYRSRTHAHLRTEVKSRVRELREQLEPDDQMLLILRVDRQLSWRDLAMIMADGEEGVESATPLDAETIDREAARLRKRFERVKAELKRLAKEDGLI